MTEHVPVGWGGHWRGDNATLETVVCPLSFWTRRPLEGLCGFGYTVARGAVNTYWASDLMHRVYHVPKIGEGVVEHYANDYAECLELAITSPEEAVRNTDTLLYFALDVYAYDIAVPGEGCSGRMASSTSSLVDVASSVSSTIYASSASSSSSSATGSLVSSVVATLTLSVTATPTSSAASVSYSREYDETSGILR